MIVTKTIFLPEYGLEIGLVRVDDKPWRVAFTGEMTRRAIAAKRAPRGSVPVIAHAKLNQALRTIRKH